jgi:hypothetical protein
VSIEILASLEPTEWARRRTPFVVIGQSEGDVARPPRPIFLP